MPKKIDRVLCGVTLTQTEFDRKIIETIDSLDGPAKVEDLLTAWGDPDWDTVTGKRTLALTLGRLARTGRLDRQDKGAYLVGERYLAHGLNEIERFERKAIPILQEAGGVMKITDLRKAMKIEAQAGGLSPLSSKLRKRSRPATIDREAYDRTSNPEAAWFNRGKDGSKKLRRDIGRNRVALVPDLLDRIPLEGRHHRRLLAQALVNVTQGAVEAAQVDRVVRRAFIQVGMLVAEVREALGWRLIRVIQERPVIAEIANIHPLRLHYFRWLEDRKTRTSRLVAEGFGVGQTPADWPQVFLRLFELGEPDIHQAVLVPFYRALGEALRIDMVAGSRGTLAPLLTQDALDILQRNVLEDRHWIGSLDDTSTGPEPEAAEPREPDPEDRHGGEEEMATAEALLKKALAPPEEPAVRRGAGMLLIQGRLHEHDEPDPAQDDPEAMFRPVKPRRPRGSGSSA